MLKKIFSLIILLAIINVTIAQQVNYENPKTYTLENISVSGIRFSNKETLIQISGLKVGQEIEIPGDDITQAVKKLWKQKMFSDINITIKEINGDKIKLEFYLQERPRLSDLNFNGVKKSAKDDLTESLNLLRGTQITDNIIKNSENIISNYYKDKGYSKVNVKIYKKQDSLINNAVVLNVFVKRGKRTRIENIFIEGNTIFSNNKIKLFKLKESKEKRWYLFFKPSKYIKQNWRDDKKNLIAEYNEKGYRDAKIVTDSIVPANERNVNIYMKIDEGKQYFFRDIKWIGNKTYTTEILNKNLQIKKGDVYDKEKLSKRLNFDEDAVGNLYSDNGYLFFNVQPIEVRIENDSVDIELRIYEGEKARINRVVISGNDRTNDHVIRRELRTVPGQLFSKRDIIRSVRELAQLGHFDPEQIVPTPIPNQADGTVDIHYSLVERGNDRIEVSGGYGRNTVIGSIGLSFNNFSMQNLFEKESWRPLPTGDGQSLSLRAQTNGVMYQYYSASFSEPWLGGKKPTSLTVSTYYSRQATAGGYSWDVEQAKLHNIQIIGAAVGIGQRLKWPDDYFTLYNELGYKKYVLTGWSMFGLGDGGYNSATLKTIFGRNSVDNPLYSRKGSSFSIGLELTPPFSSFSNTDYANAEVDEKYKWIEYHKWTFKSSWFNQLVGDLVLSTKAEFGYLGYYSKDIGYSPLGGFSLGGSGMAMYSYGVDIVGLRGYKDGAITSAHKGNGNVYTKYSLELRYPAILSETATVYGLIYTDAGNSWSSMKDFNPFNTYRSAGAGVRIFLPMLGLLGFDWGYGFDTLPGASEPSGSQFHFIMGQQF